MSDCSIEENLICVNCYYAHDFHSKETGNHYLICIVDAIEDYVASLDEVDACQKACDEFLER